jgi:branched-subunit amino acid ABC-type transport system permease component
MALADVFTLAQFANALTLASLLTLLATGLALVFGLRDVMNFAHGALFMLAAYLSYSVSGLLGWSSCQSCSASSASLSNTRRSDRYASGRRWMSRS